MLNRQSALYKSMLNFHLKNDQLIKNFTNKAKQNKKFYKKYNIT